MAISKKFRFDIFKRDGFQCQYCGRTPPVVVLEIDHIQPKKSKGQDNIENLITACFDCNRGKGDKDLRVAPSQIEEKLAILKEKEGQLKEYYKYQKKIQQLIEKDIQYLDEKWSFFHDDKYEFSTEGRLKIKNLLRNFSKLQIEEAMEIAFDKPYVKPMEKFAYMCGVLWTKKRAQEKNAKSSY